MSTNYDYERSIYASESNDLDIAIAGEALISQGLKRYTEPNFLKLVELIREADTAYVHGEMLFHDYEHPATDKRVGTYMRCDPRFLEDLRWMGFDMMSLACNHSIDFGEGGVLTNIENVDKYGFVYAGTGSNLAEARAPAYLETARGRVALLSGTTTLYSWGKAGEQRRDMQGRPGANYLRHYTEYTVDRETFAAIKQFGEALGFLQGGHHVAGIQVPPDTDTEVHLSGFANGPYNYMTFKLGDRIETHSYPLQEDLDGTLERIYDARRMAQWVLVAMHNQDVPGDEPPEHAVTMYRAMIDAGADVLIGTGPHQDRGIEIYKGRPIFYGIGNFIVQNDTVLLEPTENYENVGLGPEAHPADFYDARSGYEGPGIGTPTKGAPVTPKYWQNGMHRVKFEAGELKEIRIHPVDSGYAKPRWQAGRPLLAEGDVAREILERYQRLSEPFGTTVKIEDNVGYIRP